MVDVEGPVGIGVEVAVVEEVRCVDDVWEDSSVGTVSAQERVQQAMISMTIKSGAL
jgi:hypothetical protein